MKILGYDYDIVTKPLKDMSGNMGLFDASPQILFIASDLQSDAKESTLIHEIIEALNYHLELRLRHNQISCLESGLYQVLAENGVDLSVLFDKEKGK